MATTSLGARAPSFCSTVSLALIAVALTIFWTGCTLPSSKHVLHNYDVAQISKGAEEKERVMALILNASQIVPLNIFKATYRDTYGQRKGVIKPRECPFPSCLITLGKNRFHFGDILQQAGYAGIGVELGVFEGDSSTQWLARWTTYSRYFAVDPYVGNDQPGFNTYGWNSQDALFQQVGAKLSIFHDTQQIREKSSEAHKRFFPNELDFCYIDGPHDYESVMSDLRDYFPLVRPGGIIGGHDYSFEGVRRAVRDFFYGNPSLRSTVMFLSDEHPPSFFFLKPVSS